MRHIVSVYIAIAIFGVPWFAYTHPAATQWIVAAIDTGVGQLAAVVVAHDPKTVADLKAKYDADPSAGQKKVRILIVPGHEPDFGGTEFGDLKERDLAVELGNDIADFLRRDGRYDVIVSRDTKAWNPLLASYFKDHWDDIIEWQKAYKQDAAKLTSIGKLKDVPAPVYHNVAPIEPALRLHGINKWENENDVDIAIHVHLNDYPGHASNAAGKYSGFTVYVPERQYTNSTTTKAVAEKVFARLDKYNPVSDLRGESGGIVEDQDLIAVGSNNSVNAASMLIEYGYIYEPQFVNPDTRSVALKDLAYQTYLGLEDFFDPAAAALSSQQYDTVALPHTWKNPIADEPDPKDAFALQTALLYDGLYPPSGKTKNDCPRSGKIGPCTKEAIKAFQKKHDIAGGEGQLGEKTIRELNQRFSPRTI